MGLWDFFFRKKKSGKTKKSSKPSGKRKSFKKFKRQIKKACGPIIGERGYFQR